MKKLIEKLAGLTNQQYDKLCVRVLLTGLVIGIVVGICMAVA